MAHPLPLQPVVDRLAGLPYENHHCAVNVPVRLISDTLLLRERILASILPIEVPLESDGVIRSALKHFDDIRKPVSLPPHWFSGILPGLLLWNAPGSDAPGRSDPGHRARGSGFRGAAVAVPEVLDPDHEGGGAYSLRERTCPLSRGVGGVTGQAVYSWPCEVIAQTPHELGTISSNLTFFHHPHPQTARVWAGMKKGSLSCSSMSRWLTARRVERPCKRIRNLPATT